jgi:hypothetical protein
LTHTEILRHRLAGQMLTGPGARSATEVVRALGAVQAQEYGPTKWSLGMRSVDGAGHKRALLDADVEREVSDGRILRTHVLRPTWHFVAAEDLRWVLALTGLRVQQANGHPYRFHGLDDATFRKSRKVVARALSNGAHLTREELGAALVKAKVDIRPNRLSFLMMDAELEGVVCSGAPRGKLQTYALFESRVPPTPEIERDEALEALALRYFATRGPASAHDFAWWSGLTIVDVKRAVQIAGSALERVTIDERDHWMGRGYGNTKDASADREPTAHLLPVYDEFFIGLKDRSAIGGRLSKERRASLAQGVAPQFGFVNGELVARWRRTAVKGKMIVEIEPLTRMSAAEKKRVDEQAHRLAKFFGLALELKHGPIAR